jgi:aminoglycoside phosphotransferase (APT) family kinase protein
MPTIEAPPELTARVRDRLAEFGPVGELDVLPGGSSGLTFVATAGDRRVVIKAVPPGRPAIGRHDMLRQARVLGALRHSPVPVPVLFAVDETPPAWFAMSWVDGEAIEPVLDGVPVAGDLAAVRMFTAAQVLARLHESPANVISGLAGDEPSEPDPPRAELDRWARLMAAVPAELRPGADELRTSLSRSIPAPMPPALTHGDFRLGNVLCDGEDVAAVVDWEIWSIGDPRVDLGYFLVFTDDRHFPGIGTPVPGLPDEAALLRAYVAARGVELPDMEWFRALGRFKMAAIMGHNLRRHREGRHHAPVLEQLPPTIAALIQSGIDIVA